MIGYRLGHLITIPPCELDPHSIRRANQQCILPRHTNFFDPVISNLKIGKENPSNS